MYLTAKQHELIRVVVEGNLDGSPTDLDQVIERVRYDPTKASIQFTLRSIIKHGLVEKVGKEKRRGRIRVLISPTDLGKHFAGPRRSGSIVSTVEEEDLLEELNLAI